MLTIIIIALVSLFIVVFAYRLNASNRAAMAKTVGSSAMTVAAYTFVAAKDTVNLTIEAANESANIVEDEMQDSIDSFASVGTYIQSQGGGRKYGIRQAKLHAEYIGLTGARLTLRIRAYARENKVSIEDATAAVQAIIDSAKASVQS